MQHCRIQLTSMLDDKLTIDRSIPGAMVACYFWARRHPAAWAVLLFLIVFTAACAAAFAAQAGSLARDILLVTVPPAVAILIDRLFTWRFRVWLRGRIRSILDSYPGTRVHEISESIGKPVTAADVRSAISKMRVRELNSA